MPVLLKGEKMKGKIIHWFISMMALVILFKPSFSFAYTFEGVDVGGPIKPPVPPIHKKYISVSHKRVDNKYNEVVYHWNIGDIMNEEYCMRRRDVTNPVDKFWLEIKYFDTTYKNSQYFEKSMLEAGPLKIRGNTPYQFAIVNKTDPLSFSLRLKLKDTFLYNTTPADITIPKDTPLAIITMLCVDKEAVGNTEEDYQRTDNRWTKYNSFSMIQILSADSATFSFAKTCSILGNKDQTIELKDVTVKDLNENREVFGKSFNIRLNCPKQSVKNAYIIFTDGNNSSNYGMNVGLLTPDSTTTTMNTALVVKDEDENPLVYSKPLPRNGDFFGVPAATQGFYKFSQLSPGQQVSRTYKVYYRRVNESRPVQPGKISSKLIYNIYYN
ncbi:hypothetical protein P375_06570 [Gallibacterium genomosp. 2]|uniref:Fimbrial-type adhesion domain-containing protein n=1 Tax=Gallibacterium genomosp. 2 TaxID=155517 RepID=A0A0A2XLS8_9PAST|nr:fimbrial protein [Gallibacterium genomosp. 2]KGQ31952.1 hypothetical protein P375_06570 [Gallibacterium genomosp. 2]